MKKVFFTAITMVAFSAVSFANTIEVKKEVANVKEKEIEVALRAECRAAGNAAATWGVAHGLSDSDLSELIWNTVYACNHA